MKLLLLGAARENSVRVPIKMIKPFGDTSLFEIYLDKFKTISEMDNPFNRVVMGVNKEHKTIYNLAKESGVEILLRDNESTSIEFKGVSFMQNYLKDIEEDYIMSVNGCFPFLKVETILNIGNFFVKNPQIKSLICARERYNHFFDSKTHKPINNKDPKCLSTRDMPPILESVLHTLIYNKNYIFKTNSCWDFSKNNPYIYRIQDSEECLDIDTPLDFKICEALYNSWRN